MTEQPRPPPDRAGAAGSALAVIVGALAVWASRDFSDLGAVFPRTVGALMVALGLVYIALTLAGRTHATPSLDGSMPRRAGVAIVMLGWGFALEPLGFLPSSAAAMAVLLVVANHDRWTPRTALVRAVSVVAVLTGLYTLFKHVLLVPLP